MARITVEDCVDKITDRFELVTLAAKRGKDISSGAPIFVERDNDKNAVIALREIAANKLDVEKLRQSFLQTFSKDKLQSSIDVKNRDSHDDEIVEEIVSLSSGGVSVDEDSMIFNDDVDVED